MAQVIRPQKPSGGLGEVLGIGGAVIGGIMGGGAPGAAAGAGVGQTAGNMLEPPEAPQQPVNSSLSEANAMKRRQEQLATDNLAVLKQAEASLPSLPEDMRQQYSPAIIQARMLEQQRRGMR